MATCPEVSIETILGSECIGDSLPKINGNFSALQTAVCDAITDITALQSAPAAPTTIISDTPPVGTFSPGQMWFDSTSGITSIYYDSQWLDVGGGDSGTSAGSVNGIVQCDGNGNFSAAVAGTDYLTPANLPGTGTQGNGYQVLPGGLIVQWGITQSVGDDSNSSFTFPFAFPTACHSVVMTCSQPTAGCSYFAVTGRTSTGFNFYHSYTDGSQASDAGYYLAIGY